tara:strand:+ start:1602 stop:1925 length:324 start_codon:yes stop_codon:yes gene_type:complete
MFRLIEGGDFGLESANVGLCYVSFLPKANGDQGIFRGPAIEEEGFLDIGIDCVKNAASQIGWKSPESVAELEKAYNDLLKEHNNLKRSYAKAEKALGIVKEIKKSKK